MWLIHTQGVLELIAIQLTRGSGTNHSLRNFGRNMKLKTKVIEDTSIKVALNIFRAQAFTKRKIEQSKFFSEMRDERGDVPGWVLVVLMTTGLVTAIWTIASPRLSAILKNSLDSMNGIR
jgi:hypothetical protein